MRALPALAKTAFAGFVFSALIGLTAAFGTRLGFWNWPFGLSTLFPWCLVAGCAAFVLGLVWILWALIANDSSGARYGLIGLVGSALVLADPALSFIGNYGAPPIHDISTDTVHPPEFASLLTQRDGATNPPTYDGPDKITFDYKTTTTAMLQHKYYGDIHSAAVLISPERLFKRAVAAAYALGWNVVAIVPDAGRIEATDTTFFFGFTDDIVIRVKPAGMGARLDIRSKAREGRDDGGRDAQRVREFLKKLGEETSI